MTMRRIGPFLGSLAMLAAAAGGLAAVAVAADEVLVSQRNRRFNPETLEVARGTTVRVANDDRVTHHIFVDANGMSFDSGAQAVGTTVDVKFDKTGVFPVLCAIHPTMKLTVTVK